MSSVGLCVGFFSTLLRAGVLHRAGGEDADPGRRAVLGLQNRQYLWHNPNIKPENYCGNTVVGVDTNKPEEYPTSDNKVCDIIKWNVVDGEGNLLEITVYDDHLSCPDDCKKPGKAKVKKEPTTEVIIDTGSDMAP